MEITTYKPEYKEDFIRLNTIWIKKYFTIEQEDYNMLYNADKLLEKGAMIFFAVENESVLATCMATPINESDWEICKLATDENKQGHSILKPAMKIYSKAGFKEIP